MHQNSPFSDTNSKKILGRGHSPSPGGEGDTPSPHPTPLGAFGASILAPLAILDPRVSAPRFSAYGRETRHFSETTLSTAYPCQLVGGRQTARR